MSVVFECSLNTKLDTSFGQNYGSGQASGYFLLNVPKKNLLRIYETFGANLLVRFLEFAFSALTQIFQTARLESDSFFMFSRQV